MIGRHAPIVLPMSQSEDVLLCIHVLLAFLTFFASNVIALARFPFVAFQNVRPERQSKLDKLMN